MKTKQIVNLRILLEQTCESDEKTAGKDAQLTMRLKVLYVISENKNCPPQQIIDKLNIAKSNLALLCKVLIDEGKISANKDEHDKRNIYYNLTESGTLELNNYYKELETKINSKWNAKDIKLIEKKFDELIMIINKTSTKKKG